MWSLVCGWCVSMDRAALELKSSTVDKVTCLLVCLSVNWGTELPPGNMAGIGLTPWRGPELGFYWTVQCELDTVFTQWRYVYFFLAEAMTWMGDKYIINYKTHFTMQATKNVFLFSGEILVNLNLCVPGYLGEFVFRAVFELGSEIDQPSLGNLTTLGVRSLSLLKKRLRTFW